MPPGIPVATVAINGAMNAGILAASILSISDEALAKKLEEYKQGLDKMVHEKIGSLTDLGYEKYLESM
jgi:5-(carboxyamino)imidazole ribonucleotide mutase